jgi:hypothetical protein
MSSPTHEVRTFQIPRHPRGAADVALQAGAAVAHAPADCREAVTLAASELCDNLISYGRGSAPATLSIEDDHGTIRVRLVDPGCSTSDARAVQDQLQRLRAHEPRVAYRARLSELLDNPSLPRARLGLLRLAFEGKFRLSARYDETRLELVAERDCSSARRA